MLVGGSIAELIGRKRTLITGNICILAGWIIIYFSTHFPMLMVGRSIIGIGIGICLPVTTLLMSEIALIKMRGPLSMISMLIINLAVVYSLILSATLPLNFVIVMSMVPTLIFLLTSFFLTESPTWLMKKGQAEKAKIALLNLRGSKYQLNNELKELENLVKIQDNKTTSLTNRFKELKSRSNAIPLIITMTIVILQVHVSILDT